MVSPIDDTTTLGFPTNSVFARPLGLGFLVDSTMSSCVEMTLPSFLTSRISSRDDDDVLMPCRKSKPNGMTERMVCKYYDSAQTLCNCIKVSFDPAQRCVNPRCLECELPFVQTANRGICNGTDTNCAFMYVLFHCESNFFRRDEKRELVRQTPITVPRMRNEKIISAFNVPRKLCFTKLQIRIKST